MKTSDWTRRFAERAAKKFSGRGPVDGTFNTAGYQLSVEEEFGQMPTGASVERALSVRKDIVRLAGGCHWSILPNRYQQF